MAVAVAEAAAVIVAAAVAEAADTAGRRRIRQRLLTELYSSRIETVLDEHVRPDLRADGGDVVVVGLDEDHILQVR